MAKIPNVLLRLAWTGRRKEKPCAHRHLIQDVEATAEVCEACAKLGDEWVHLRVCLICGHVGC